MEFVATKDKRKLYRMIRSTYARWTLGHMGVAACVGTELAFLRWIYTILSASNVSMNTLFFCLGVCLFPVPFAIIFRGIAISGGREILYRLTDKVTLTETFMLMEYVPKNARNDSICYRMNYSDIRRIAYQKGRLKIEGAFQVIIYHHVNWGAMEFKNIKEVKDGSFYLYAYFDSFKECMRQISLRSGKTILRKDW